ncbi:MAG: CPBP family intramembrane metalloprotease [Polyangiaceae bacterium]|nr:CPBP family intramembrane metalloprotease [Polyangiaceae bacterium]
MTLAVTALSWLLPARFASTGVGFAFLFATYALVLRRDDAVVRRHGLSLGGLFERDARLDPLRLLRSLALACGVALLVAAVIFPPFVVGYPIYWGKIVGRALHYQGHPIALPPRFGEEVLGQVFVIALPEEAFFRGYLQTRLEGAWPSGARVLGATVGPALVVTSLVFALGHVATQPQLPRLAVFFPSLLFGVLRGATGGVGASVAFHAMCNLLTGLLAVNFGLSKG